MRATGASVSKADDPVTSEDELTASEAASGVPGLKSKSDQPESGESKSKNLIEVKSMGEEGGSRSPPAADGGGASSTPPTNPTGQASPSGQ